MSAAHDPIHPGEIFLEEFLNPMGITQYRLAQTISVPARPSMRSSTASAPSCPTRRFDCRALGTSDRFWMNLQSRYDLDVAITQNGDNLDQIRP
jgi:addiction module HigA family antidote